MTHLKPLLAALIAVTVLSGCIATTGGSTSTSSPSVAQDDAINGLVIRAPGLFAPTLFGI